MKRLQEALDINNMSHSELARRLELTQPAVSAIVKSGSTNLDTAISICRELGVSLDWVCGLNDIKDSQAKRFNRMKLRLIKMIEKA